MSGLVGYRQAAQTKHGGGNLGLNNPQFITENAGKNAERSKKVW